MGSQEHHSPTATSQELTTLKARHTHVATYSFAAAAVTHQIGTRVPQLQLCSTGCNPGHTCHSQKVNFLANMTIRLRAKQAVHTQSAGCWRRHMPRPAVGAHLPLNSPINSRQVEQVSHDSHEPDLFTMIAQVSAFDRCLWGGCSQDAHFNPPNNRYLVTVKSSTAYTPVACQNQPDADIRVCQEQPGPDISGLSGPAWLH